jgi:membrane protein YqaA with SNARE-associated domain
MESIIGVFLSAFLAATILPFSSEIVLSTLYGVGDSSAILLLVVATTGNVLGSLVNWAFGQYLLHWQDHKWFPFSANQLRKANVWFQRYGTWTLLMAWLPVVGDPLTFVAGLLRVNVWLFLILVTIGKAARYTAVLWLTVKIV